MGSHSILFVDDNEDILDSFSRWFCRRGFEVTTAAHPQQALSAVSRIHFDAAVLEATLPEMSGIDLMVRLKGQCDMPCIILSGNSARALEVEAMKRGGIRYLLKPTSMRRLEEILSEVLIDDETSTIAT